MFSRRVVENKGGTSSRPYATWPGRCAGSVRRSALSSCRPAVWDSHHTGGTKRRRTNMAPMISQLDLRKMLDNSMPRLWCAIDWRKVGGKLVRFIDWRQQWKLTW